MVRGAASLGSLIDFLGIDEDLVAAAAANSAALNPGPSRGDLDIWIRNLPENEKNVLLMTAISESGDRWKSELLRRFHREKRPSASQGVPAAGRTAGELLSGAQARAERRTQRAEADRIRELAIRQGHETEFRAKIQNLRAKHAAKASFIERLTKADF